MREIIKLLRVKHYIKNVLVFMPLVFGGMLFNVELLTKTIVAFIPFCLGTSIVYIINDIRDIEKDRQHPTKCKRPLASGAISVKMAIVLIAILATLVVAFLTYTIVSPYFSFMVGLWLISYIFLNLAYSLKLKNVPVMDVLILALGFVIRIYYGSCVTFIEVSPWLYMTVLGGAFYLGMGKRRNEITSVTSGETREVLSHYTYDFLDKNMHVCVAFTEVCYALWAIQHESRALLWTVPIVMVIFMRYSLIIETKESEGNPIDVFFKDWMLLVLAVIYVVLVVTSVYWA